MIQESRNQAKSLKIPELRRQKLRVVDPSVVSVCISVDYRGALCTLSTIYDIRVETRPGHPEWSATIPNHVDGAKNHHLDSLLELSGDS